MHRRAALIALAAVAAIAVLVWLASSGGPRAPQTQTALAEQAPPPTPAPEQRIMLLFAGSDGLLHPELRSVPLPAEVDERIQVVLRELLAGPGAASRLAPVVPYAASLEAIFIDELGNAFVDLSAPPEPLAGSSTELMLAYGVVDSVILNCPEVKAVQILFGGREVATLAGHLDLSRPLALNKRFIAGS